jgi:acyl-activating enzyme 14
MFENKYSLFSFFLCNRFKVPKSYHLWTQPFPLTSTGKIRREELKREILAAIQIPSNL